MRKKNDRYLRFRPGVSHELPQKRMSDIPLLLYLHVPFCEELCPYCSFHRIAFTEGPARAYFTALRKEIAMYKDNGYDFQALYIGGGTPTVLIDELSATIELVRNIYSVKEISVETNPNHLVENKLSILKDAGVNRLSVGVQTFNDGILKSLERYHKYGSGAEIAERLNNIKGYFDTLNVDMIFNFPAQTKELLAHDLSVLTALKADQITYYPLMVSSATQKVVGRKLGVVDYNRGNDFYNIIVEKLEKEYYPSTAWCFSRNKAMIDEYVINYDEYAGLGSGSIGYLSGCTYANTFDITDYIKQIESGRFPVVARRDCNLKERLLYDFLMKLFGLTLDLDELSVKHKVNAFRHLLPEILFFILAGALRKNGATLKLTDKGRYYWVIMMREFFVSVNNFRDHCRSLVNQSLAH